MTESPFEMRFDPQTIKHLGVRMYSRLAPTLAEIISNAYDADANNVTIALTEENGIPKEIRIEDDGTGISHDEINSKFLVIGRNRRDDEGDKPSKKYNRLPTGKKGLGKLALFGLAKTITISAKQSGIQNQFVLDWDDLIAARGSYRPRATSINTDTSDADGTVITMTGLKRKTAFDFIGLADSLSRIFIFDTTFNLILESPSGNRISIDNKRKYSLINVEFDWNIESSFLVPVESEYSGKLIGQLLTSKKPIVPSSGLRGITLFSRGKLVNAPEFFSISTSSHFYQYLTGWISIDFIDLLNDDVISTNRQSIDWEHPDMAKLRKFLSGIVSQVNADWRKKRKEKKVADLKEKTGIDTETWTNTLPDDVKENTKRIIETLGGEDALERYTPVIKALHDIIPEYPLLHWRHLHNALRERIKSYYEYTQYGDAASQGVQIYCEIIRKLTRRKEDGRDLVNRIFGSSPFDTPPDIQLNDLDTESLKNIQEGQGHLSRGVVTGFRNPISHGPIDTNVPALFTELDCLNILSLVSYLITRMDNAKVNASSDS
ncbi:TIGR02391 family protein [Candidatus Parcubacteria bacterium]|nr:TIGR02391 family protein [Candidatus Parcubacteria bacterium]